MTVSYTHLRAHETPEHLVCRLLLEKKKKKKNKKKKYIFFFFFLMIRRPPRSTLDRSSAASDVYKRQVYDGWQSIGERMISNNGKWVVYAINPQEGDNELVIQSSDVQYSCLLYTSP